MQLQIIKFKHIFYLFISNIYFRYKEINHAIFFICEMDIRRYKIPRLLLQEYFKNQYVIQFHKNQITIYLE